MKTYEKLLDLLASAVLVDLTHPLDESCPYWPTHKPYSVLPGDSLEKGDESFWRTVTIGEHSGTHIDAIAHFIAGGQTIDETPVDRVMGRGVNIDATSTPPCGRFPLEGILNFEKENGEIKEGDIVFFRFGWDVKWNDSKVFLSDWPGISKEAAEYLASKKIKAAACDCLSLDSFGGQNLAHEALLGNGINIIENVDKLGELPPFFGVIGLPCRFVGGSGSTLRLVAITD